MTNQISKASIFVLVDEADLQDLELIKGWLGDREVTYYQARNIFDALDELCDFTVRTPPDLILVPTDGHSQNADLARKMIHDVAPEMATAVLTLSRSADSASGGAIRLDPVLKAARAQRSTA